MDRLTAIEKTFFLGREFLLWLWFHSETRQELKIREEEEVEIDLEDRLILEPYGGGGWKQLLSGEEAAAAPEARFALQMNNLPSELKLRLIKGTLAWSFTLRWENLQPKGIKIPENRELPFDEQISYRMEMIEILEELVEELWKKFLEIRTTSQWLQVLHQIRLWIEGEWEGEENSQE